jgi:Zn finger protein HypA/HybF involved in hydrogenase expression
MNNIKGIHQFESFTLKTVGGKELVYCKGCQHTFEAPKPQYRKLICPACAAMGLLNRGMAYLRPIERKF